MKLSKLAVLVATVVPAVLAYKKYQKNPDYYDEKVKSFKDTLSCCSYEDLKVSKEQQKEIKDVIKSHTDAVSKEIKDILNAKQKEVVDKV